MPSTSVTKVDRRDFIKLGAVAGTGLLLGFRLPDRRESAAPIASLEPNAFLRVDPSGDVTIWVARSDMGQGVRTALPMIVADELDADWSRVRVVQADAHPTKYGRMMTVGSTSVRNGASGRSMGYGELAEAAAALPVPAQPRLKDPSRFTLIGKRIPLIDTREK